MSVVTAPIRAVPIGSVTINGQRYDVATHPEFVRFFDALMARVGGPTGASTPDLVISQFEDAGVEETKALLSIAQNEAAQSSEAALREQLEALSRRVAALEQGISL